MSEHSVLDYLGISGLIAIIGGAVGYGQLHGRVKSLEDKDASQANAVAIARLEEQLKAMDDKLDLIIGRHS